MRIKKLISAILAALMLLSAVQFASAADGEIVWTFDNEDSKNQFSSVRGTKVNGIKDGALDLTLTGRADNNDDPALFSKTIELNTAEYNQIVVKAKINIETISPNNGTTIYFKTDKAPAFSQSKTVGVPIELKNGDFVDYVFNMGAHEEWTGVCNAFFYSFHNNAIGSVQIKSITFRYNASAKPVVEQPVTSSIGKGAGALTSDVPKQAVQPEVSNFVKSRKYSGTFGDVALDQWYYREVVSAYELSLVNGKGEGAFDPNGNMTVGEAIALAARMHNIYNGGSGSFTQGEPWYQVYVDYATEKGFLPTGGFDSYTRNVKRHEMATLFAKALPATYYKAINKVSVIPDVAADAPYFADVQLLYNAGIAMGNDGYGTFYPGNDIKRSEVAAIVNRVAIKNNRLEKTLFVKSIGMPMYIADDPNFSTRNTTDNSIIASGWNFDNRGGTPKIDEEAPYTLNDISTEFGTALVRDLTMQDGGIVTLETRVMFASGADGFYVEFLSSEGLSTYKLITKNGVFNVVVGGNLVPLDLAVEKKSYSLKVILNLDKQEAETIIGNTSYGKHPFASAIGNIATYKVGTTEEDVLYCAPSGTYIYCNYTVNEGFSGTPTNGIPYDWTSNVTGDATVGNNSGDMVLKTASGSSATLQKTYDPISGEIIFDSLILLPEATGGATFTFGSGETPVVTFSAVGDKFLAGDKELRTYAGTMWYKLRFVIDTDKQTAEIKVSGKTLATVPFVNTAAAIDNFTVSMNNVNNTLRVNSVSLAVQPKVNDYVPEPVIPEGADDYNIGINVCSLWRNGYHWGWDNVSPFSELKPILGYYDEGLAEVADWEIKMMAEHGIDFQMYCWYHSSERPLKTFSGSAPSALFDGFMNAKYSDKMKFALLWEAANGNRPSSSEDFRNYFVPFWIEYFFSDDRYMTIDNKPVIVLFGATQLSDALGGDAKVKAEFDYVREVCKTLGFDGAIFQACSGSSDAASLKRLKAMGFDAISAYNWGASGNSAVVNTKSINTQMDLGVIDVIPTVSTGFNNVGWAGTRKDNISLANYTNAWNWVKDVALKRYAEGTWQRKTVVISTWNEYGEGTYIMPSADLNGYGYLDVIRDTLTKGGAHSDSIPTSTQQARLNFLYPQNREIIRAQGYYKAPEATKKGKKWTFADGDALSAEWNKSNMSTVTAADGVVTGTASNTDPIFSMVNDANLEIGKAQGLKIRMSGPVGANAQVYFTTKDDSKVAENKSGRVQITESGMADYYLPLSQNGSWKGTLLKLRFDPIDKQDSFTVESITMMEPEEGQTYYINDIVEKFSILPVVDNGYHMIPMLPDSGIFYHFNSYFTWNKATKTLSIAANHGEAVFTMGSNVAKINGVYKELACTPYLEDGVPMIPLEILTETFNYELSVTDTAITVTTPQKDAFSSINDRVENEWEFSLPGDTEGWTFSNAIVATTLQGTLQGIAVKKPDGSYDPILTSPTLNINGNVRKKIVIGMRHNITSEITDANKGKANVGIYFKTSTAGLAESRSKKLPIEKSSNGQFVEYILDMSDKVDWTGTITQIRVDPFDLEGDFEIDYIRFIQ